MGHALGRLLIGAGIAIALAVPSAAAAAPNVLLVLTDDQRWDTLTAMPEVNSELVDHGVTFSNAFVTNPLCCPSRVSILTGRYSHSTGVYNNSGRFGGFASFHGDSSTIATWLKAAGYRTGYFGKYLNGYSGTYVPPGWRRWLVFTNPGYDSFTLNDNRVLATVTDRYSTDYLADRAASFVASSSQPFFAVFAPWAPHSPAVPADRHEGAFSGLPPFRPPSYNEDDVSDKPAWLRARPQLDPALQQQTDDFRLNQLRSLLAVDEGVGRIVAALRNTGKLANTVIIFTSDNGLMWGEHRVLSKRWAFEESLRVPFVVRYDPLTPSARTDDRLVVNVDLAPTIAALAGVAAPNAEGRSLVGLLAGTASSWRKRFLLEHRRPQGPPTYCGIRGRQFKFVLYATGERELYDLANDPYELVNRAEDPAYAGTTAAMHTYLARACNPPPPSFSRLLLCTVEGGAGRDVLTGTRRYDILCGRGGGDSLDPRAGRDYVFAGPGADRVFARDGRRDVVDCGDGNDVALLDFQDAARRCEKVVRRPVR